MVVKVVVEDLFMISIKIFMVSALTTTKRTAHYSFISAQQKMKTNPATNSGVIVNKAWYMNLAELRSRESVWSSALSPATIWTAKGFSSMCFIWYLEEAAVEDMLIIYIKIYKWYTLLTATKRTALYSFISAQQKMKTNPATKAGVIVNKAWCMNLAELRSRESVW